VFEIHCIPQNTVAHAAVMSGGIFAFASLSGRTLSGIGLHFLP
jgi:hypothetical protein